MWLPIAFDFIKDGRHLQRVLEAMHKTRLCENQKLELKFEEANSTTVSSLDPRNVAPSVESNLATYKIQMEMLLLLSYILMILGTCRMWCERVSSGFNFVVLLSSLLNAPCFYQYLRYTSAFMQFEFYIQENCNRLVLKGMSRKKLFEPNQ